MLWEGDWNVSEIDAIVGYGKPSKFAAAYKKKYGVGPKDYRGSYFDDTKKSAFNRFWVKMGRFWVGLVCDN